MARDAAHNGHGEVPTDACPLPLSEAEEARVRAHRAARRGRAEAKAEAREVARAWQEDDLDAAVAAQLEALAAQGEDRPAEPVDPHAPKMTAKVQTCDGVRYLVVKVAQERPSEDQLAFEWFKRLGP